MAHPVVQKSHILHRALREEPLDIVSGEGITFKLASGEVIIDASAGPAVSCLGHRQPEVEAAILKQLRNIGYIYSGSGYTCQVAEELASILLQDRPGGLAKAIFVNSGSEATDAALKLATQYWTEKGQSQRVNFIARRQSYHGNTLGALSVSGHVSRRALYNHQLAHNVTFVDPCHAYRCKLTNESDESYVARLRKQFENEVLHLGPNTVAAFIAETLPGTTLGCVPATPGYFKAIREVCDKYDILLILDEIMCGLGKTGKMHAWEDEGIAPDIQTIGKALGAGFIPLSGVLANQKIFDVLANGSGTLVHGHTFQAHPTACAAAVAVQKIIKRDNVLDNVRLMGNILEAELRREIGGLPYVGDIHGRGLFWAVEFMQDTAKMIPFDPAYQFSNRIIAVARDLGLNILGNLGKTGEIDVELVIICPPYIINANEVKTVVALLKQAVTQVSQQFASEHSPANGVA